MPVAVTPDQAFTPAVEVIGLSSLSPAHVLLARSPGLCCVQAERSVMWLSTPCFKCAFIRLVKC